MPGGDAKTEELRQNAAFRESDSASRRRVTSENHVALGLLVQDLLQILDDTV